MPASCFAGGPAMSVILVAPGGYHPLRTTIGHLRTQTGRHQLEIVIVSPSTEPVELDQDELACFHSMQLVKVDPGVSPAGARAAGIRGARAPVVVLAEDHSYPDPGWAEALIAAHQGPWAVVGPEVGNANPASAISWANLLIEYGQWLSPAPAGERDHLPGHNSAYKRDILVGYGDRLEAMLEAESVLHWDLRARGLKLYLEPAARTRHLNVSKLSSLADMRIAGGRLFAGWRAKGWPWPQRLARMAGASLRPVLGMRETLPEIRRSGLSRDLFPRILPALLLALALDGLGRMIGYAFGPGLSPSLKWYLEIDREHHVGPRDLPVGDGREAQPCSGEGPVD